MITHRIDNSSHCSPIMKCAFEGWQICCLFILYVVLLTIPCEYLVMSEWTTQSNDKQHSDPHTLTQIIHIIHVCLNRLKKANVTFTPPSTPKVTTCRDMTCVYGRYVSVCEPTFMVGFVSRQINASLHICLLCCETSL